LLDLFLKKIVKNFPNFQNFECKLTAFQKTGPVSAVGKPTGFRLFFNHGQQSAVYKKGTASALRLLFVLTETNRKENKATLVREAGGRNGDSDGRGAAGAYRASLRRGGAVDEPSVVRLKAGAVRPYMNGTGPPPDTCCGPLKDAVKNELPCLCALYASPEIFKAFNINISDALRLSKRCGVSDTTAACAGNFSICLQLILFFPFEVRL
jgi:hypothetical protein